MSDRIAVAVSGGVDSLMAAHLLKADGNDVFGIHFITGYEPPDTDETGSDTHGPDQRPRIERIRAMTDALGIRLQVVDCADAFHRSVVSYFTESYRRGETPNPCMRCNPVIKFGVIWESASQHGADCLATGHYARILTGSEGRPGLYRGLDRKKDQSYFLSRLTQEQLSRSLFPLGDHTKAEIQKMAESTGLSPVFAAESQDVCFIHDDNYAAFLAKHSDITDTPGPITDSSGNVIGSHAGLHRYTIGQRRGINIPAEAPYYVVRIDADQNRLVVGSREDLATGRCHLTDVNWLIDPPAATIRTRVKIRYRTPGREAAISPGADDTATVGFDTPVDAVTPGQGAVFYDGDRVLGSGWIADIETGNSR